MIYFVIALIAFLLFDICIIVKVFLRKPCLRKKDIYFIRSKWKILSYSTDFKQAIFEADKLVNYALEQYGKKGSFAEKLKSSDNLFSNIDNLWEAHKVRNRIAHEIDFHLRDRIAKKSLKAFEQALQDLKVL